MRSSPKLPNMPLYSSLSNSLQTWLGRELENRGIDSMIYTRYILSILQQDSPDTDVLESEFFPPSKRASMLGLTPCLSQTSGARSSVASGAIKDTAPVRVPSGKGSRAGKKVDKKKNTSSGLDLSADERKKTAAVECLRSVSDEDSGIEGLVDELCMKLKEQSTSATAESVGKSSLLKYLDPESSDSVISTSPDDIAERYYAAFPALSDSGEETGNPVVASASADVSWSTIAQKGSPVDDAEESTEMVNAMVTEVLEDGDGPEDLRGVYFLRDKHDATYHADWSPRYRYKNRRSPSGHLRWQGNDLYPNLSDDHRAYRETSQERFDRRYAEFSQSGFMISGSPTMEHLVHGNTYRLQPIQAVQPLWEEQNTSRISLQEIFGTKEVSKIEPCKTLVVDGQLVRLCATSVNSDNLDKITNLSLKEAPMEECVAQNLWHEVEKEQAESDPAVVEESLKSESEAKEGNDSGCEQSPKKLVNDRRRIDAVVVESSEEDDQVNTNTDVEDPVWYSGPVEQLTPGSTVMSASRLYKRRSTGGSEQLSARLTPPLDLLWEEVWDDSGVYLGARLKDDSSSVCDTLLDEDQLDYSLVKEILELAETSSESEAEYVDMSGGSVLSAARVAEEPVTPGRLQAFGEGAQVADGGKSPDRLEIFKALAGDDEVETSTCTCNSSDMSTPSKQLSCLNNEKLIQELDVSQYKGCVTPEITQNKVPDDRPVFFLESRELNNNHSTSAKVNEHCVRHGRYCTYSNLLHSSFMSSSASSLSSEISRNISLINSSSTFPLCTESFASLWNTNESSTTNTEALASLWRTKSKNTADVRSLWTESSAQCSYDNISPESQTYWAPKLPHHQINSSLAWPLSTKPDVMTTDLTDILPRLAKTSFPCTSFSLATDAIWKDPPLKNPPKIWDINLSPKLGKECALDTFGSTVANYMLHMHDPINTSVFQSDLIQGCSTGSLMCGSQTTETDDVWSLQASECSEDEGICEHDENYYTIPYSPVHTMSYSQSVDCFATWCRKNREVSGESATNRMTGSMELLPSETSAFSTDSLPRRLPHLPHVQSEPSLSPRQPHHKWGQNKYRMVQVKHLYKPDTSILRHLGLASECDDEPARNKTPEHHFKPIASSASVVIPEPDKPKNKNVTAHSYVILDGVTGAKKDEEALALGAIDLLEELSCLSGSSRSTSGSLYQRYRGQETVDVSFIPRFKICREHKYIQTGEVSPWQLAAEAENDLNQEISERLVNEVLGVDSDTDSMCGCDSYSEQNDEWDSLYSQTSEKAGGLSKVGPDGDSSPTDWAKFWGEETFPELPLDTSDDPTDINMTTSSHDASIWTYSFDSMPDLVPNDPTVDEQLELVDTKAESNSPVENLDQTLTQNFLEELVARSKENIGNPCATTVSDIYRYDMDKSCDELIRDLEVLQVDFPLEQITKAVEISKGSLSNQKPQVDRLSHDIQSERPAEQEHVLFPLPDELNSKNRPSDIHNMFDWTVNNADIICRLEDEPSGKDEEMRKHQIIPRMTGDQWSHLQDKSLQQLASEQDNQDGHIKHHNNEDGPCHCGDCLYPGSDAMATVCGDFLYPDSDAMVTAPGFCEGDQYVKNPSCSFLHGYQP